MRSTPFSPSSSGRSSPASIATLRESTSWRTRSSVTTSSTKISNVPKNRPPGTSLRQVYSRRAREWRSLRLHRVQDSNAQVLLWVRGEGGHAAKSRRMGTDIQWPQHFTLAIDRGRNVQLALLHPPQRGSVGQAVEDAGGSRGVASRPSRSGAPLRCVVRDGYE